MKSIAGGMRSFSNFFQPLPQFAALAALIGAAVFVEHAAAIPWVPLVNPAAPSPNTNVLAPNRVPGKDYSDVRDKNAAGVADPEQVIAWDGSGGVRDAFDYSGSRAALLPPPVTLDTEVDGIAAGGDALFQALRDNQAALLFSVETDPRIMYSRATNFPGALPGSGVWATPQQIDLTNPPLDTDGLELWGGDNNDDSDRYSLAGDPFVDIGPALRKVSVFQYTPPAGPSAPHTFTSDLAAAIDRQLLGGLGNGPVFGYLSENMDVDAIMTFGPQITFSVRPIDIIGTPFSFDGGEIFEYDGLGSTTRFLQHGGLTFNTALDIRTTFNVPHENIDALEAVAGIPEPSTLVLLMLAAALPLRLLRRESAF